MSSRSTRSSTLSAGRRPRRTAPAPNASCTPEHDRTAGADPRASCSATGPARTPSAVSSVEGVKSGDEVACLLPDLGGYAESALTSSWTRKPPDVRWSDAAALPASAEAAVGVLKQLGLTGGETLLILGAAGSVGMIAAQLAVSRGATVIRAAAPRDHELVRDLGADPVSYGPGLADRVRETVASVDAVLDAAGKGELKEAVDLAGGPARVVTLADEHAADLGVAVSAFTSDPATQALDQTMSLLAPGAPRPRRQRHPSPERAAEAHQLLESGDTHEKLILDAVWR